MATLNGAKAVRLEAKKVTWGNTPKANLYEIDGKQVWIPKSVSTFEVSKESQEQINQGSFVGNTSGILLVEEWFYNKNINSDD